MLGESLIEKVDEFDYLGILLGNKNNWKPQILKSELIQKHRAAAILKFANCHSFHPTSPVLEIWKAQAVAGASYGSELWGHTNCETLLLVENKFLRSLLKLPIGVPLLPLRLELNIPSPWSENLGNQGARTTQKMFEENNLVRGRRETALAKIHKDLSLGLRANRLLGRSD